MSSSIAGSLLQGDLFEILAAEKDKPIVVLCWVDRSVRGESFFLEKSDRGNKAYRVRYGQVPLGRWVDPKNRKVTIQIPLLGAGRRLFAGQAFWGTQITVCHKRQAATKRKLT